MWFEERLIYFPSRKLARRPGDYGLEHEEIWLPVGRGRRAHGWFLPAPKRLGSGCAVLVCHGNSGNLSDRLPRAAAMHHQLGTDVLLFDYRGFGWSEGRPDEEGTYEDAQAFYRHLTEGRGWEPERLVLFGESLGAAVAVELALRERAAALVLEAPFTSISAMARAAYPRLPLARFVRNRYDSIAKISRIRLPLLILHGTLDPVVPFSQGEELFRAANEPKALVAVEGADHGDLYRNGGDRYWEPWRKLLPEDELRLPARQP